MLVRGSNCVRMC